MRAEAGLLLLLLLSSAALPALPGALGLGGLALKHELHGASAVWNAMASRPARPDDVVDAGPVALTVGLHDAVARFLAELG